MENKMTQRAGDNCNQIQANNVFFNQGIEEKRAREIFKEMFEQTRENLSQEARTIANTRVTEFENDLIARMQKVEGAINAFADPSFQMLLTSAHKTAIVTDKNEDYQILSELLLHRIKKGNDRNATVGIRKAIEIVNEIPDEALLGLTVFYAIEKIVPCSGNIIEGLDVLNELFEKIIIDELPKGIEWIEQLDILDAIRINKQSSFLKLEDFYKKRLEGYCCIGIKKDTDNYTKAIEVLKQKRLDGFLIEHELNPNYLRLSFPNNNSIESYVGMIWGFDGKELKIERNKLKKEEKETLHKVYNMYEKDSVLFNQVYNKFVEEIRKRDNLNKIKIWLESIPCAFDITSIGKVLAHANAQKCYDKFPPLN